MIRHYETTGVSLARVHGDTWKKRKNGRQHVKNGRTFVQEVTSRKHKKTKGKADPFC